jgi:hypothetical protein
MSHHATAHEASQYSNRHVVDDTRGIDRLEPQISVSRSMGFLVDSIDHVYLPQDKPPIEKHGSILLQLQSQLGTKRSGRTRLLPRMLGGFREGLGWARARSPRPLTSMYLLFTLHIFTVHAKSLHEHTSSYHSGRVILPTKRKPNSMLHRHLYRTQVQVQVQVQVLHHVTQQSGRRLL